MNKLFSQTGVAEVLIFLLDNNNVIQKDLREKLHMNNTTVMRVTYQLMLHGLIISCKGNYNSTIYKITETGKQVAILFKQINNILTET